ncbi:MAG: hypothetical protein HY840_05480 [Bacteroidetes bacterium]|nr:hypothetical protein [Bacteroidota bacterium]
MNKKQFLNPVISIFILYQPVCAFAQFTGGNSDGHALVSKTDVAVCALPL